MVFLVEILTTLDIAPDNPDTRDCGHCGACRKACPGKAIMGNCQIDCRLCISYLTIEHRGEWILEESSEVMKTEAARNSIYGCDTCLRVCPHNRGVPPTSIEDFHPSAQMLSLSFEDIKSLKNSEDLQRLIPGSPMTRAGVSGLLLSIIQAQRLLRLLDRSISLQCFRDRSWLALHLAKERFLQVSLRKERMFRALRELL